MTRANAGIPPMPGDRDFWYPRWREMWEEELDEPTRTWISRAVRNGSALNDPVEARFAVTLAVRDQRAWRLEPVSIQTDATHTELTANPICGRPGRLDPALNHLWA